MTRLESFFIGLTAGIATGLILWPFFYAALFYCLEWLGYAISPLLSRRKLPPSDGH